MKKELSAIFFGILAIGFTNTHAQNSILERGRQAYENMTPAQQAEVYRAITSGDQIRLNKPIDKPAPLIADSLENANNLFRQDRRVESFRMYERLATNGNLDAQVELGTNYINGSGTSVNEDKGYQLLHDAANKGSGLAAQRIGFLKFSKGNKADGVAWIELAAKMEDPLSQVLIGQRYENGTEVKRDYKKSVSWYKKAVANGYEVGFYQLAKMYESGKGIKKNKLLAAAIFPKGKDYDLDRLTLQSTLTSNELREVELMQSEIYTSPNPLVVIEKIESRM